MARTYRRKEVKIPYWAYTNQYELIHIKRKFNSWIDEVSGKEKTIEWDHKVFIKRPKQDWVVDEKEVREYHSNKFDRFRKKFVKRVWAKKRRRTDKTELYKFCNMEDYEPTWFTTKIDTWWWD